MTTKSEELLKLADQQEKDRDNFAARAAQRVGQMIRELGDTLGAPALTSRLQVLSVAGEETVEGFDGTLISRKGCHFGMQVAMRRWQMQMNSAIFPAGDRLMARIDPTDRNAIDVTDDAGVKAWADWAVNTWVPSQFEITIAGTLSAKIKKS